MSEGLDHRSRPQGSRRPRTRKRIRGLRVFSGKPRQEKKLIKESTLMSTATVPLSGGAPPDLLGVSELFDAAQTAGLDLPCRSGDNPDLWFADTPTDLEQAKRLCVDCPVRAECLAG